MLKKDGQKQSLKNGQHPGLRKNQHGIFMQPKEIFI